MQYRVNDRNVIAETMGDETIIVNLASGHYFSLQGANVDVWDYLQRGHTTSQIADLLTKQYDVSAEDAEAATAALVAELEREELVAETDGLESPAEITERAVDEENRQPFSMPPLSKFTDMQDIILLDPVHEVDQRGWPHAPTAR
jgi:hypothetical protein